MREVIRTSILQGFDQKNRLFEGWSWFKFNNLELALGTSLKSYNIVAKRLRLKVSEFWGLTPTFVEITGKILVGGAFLPIPLSILKRVKPKFFTKTILNIKNSMVLTVSVLETFSQVLSKNSIWHFDVA